MRGWKCVSTRWIAIPGGDHTGVETGRHRARGRYLGTALRVGWPGPGIETRSLSTRGCAIGRSGARAGVRIKQTGTRGGVIRGCLACGARASEYSADFFKDLVFCGRLARHRTLPSQRRYTQEAVHSFGHGRWWPPICEAGWQRVVWWCSWN